MILTKNSKIKRKFYILQHEIKIVYKCENKFSRFDLYIFL